MIFGQEHIPEAKLFRLELQILHDRGPVPPSLRTLAELGSIDGIGGDAFLVYEFLDLRAEVSSLTDSR